jgi:hypothetical protein
MISFFVEIYFKVPLWRNIDVYVRNLFFFNFIVFAIVVTYLVKEFILVFFTDATKTQTIQFFILVFITAGFVSGLFDLLLFFLK